MRKEAGHDEFLVSLGKTIRKYRTDLDMTQEELAMKVGSKSEGNAKSYISKLESGQRNPSASQLKRIAGALNVSAAVLLQEAAADQQVHPTGEYFRVPVLGSVAAGIPIEMIQDIVGYEDLSTRQFKENQKDYFCLKIKGHSMEPKICDGDIVVVHKQEDADDGQIVIATVDGEDATCKRLKKYAEGITLIPYNPSFDPIRFSNDEIIQKPVCIIGVVKELRREV